MQAAAKRRTRTFAFSASRGAEERASPSAAQQSTYAALHTRAEKA